MSVTLTKFKVPGRSTFFRASMSPNDDLMHQRHVLYPVCHCRRHIKIWSGSDDPDQIQIRFGVQSFTGLNWTGNVRIINVDAGTKWLLNPPVFLRLRLHVWCHGRNSATERKTSISIKSILTQIPFEVLYITATHLHRFYCVIAVVMDRLLLAVWGGVSKTSNMDHITVVESNKHSEDARGRMHWLQWQTKLNDSSLQ